MGKTLVQQLVAARVEASPKLSDNFYMRKVQMD